jgi:hypothetical protein
VLTEDAFWSLIEVAWEDAPGMAPARARLASRTATEKDVAKLTEALETVVPSLRATLDALGADDLLFFDRMLERKLYELDRMDLHAKIGGSDEEFLAARAFVVVMGRPHYDAVRQDPGAAVEGGLCEPLSYLATELYESKYGEFPTSDISRESGSNPHGWPNLS